MYSQVQGPQNVILCFAPASQNGLKGKNTRLKHQSEQFVREKTYKGGRGAKYILGTEGACEQINIYFCNLNVNIYL